MSEPAPGAKACTLVDWQCEPRNSRTHALSPNLEDRPIYVFDEWAADQDPSSKRSSI
jgi:hypothetical protein